MTYLEAQARREDVTDYYSPDTTCRCGQDVRLDELVEVHEWIGGKWILDLVCAECAKEDQ